MHPMILLLIFIVSALVGYKLISNVPSMLHTSLMSGMNSLDGLTLMGAMAATGAAAAWGSRFFGFVAVVLAMINVAGGFGVTARMLALFKRKEKAK